MTTRRHTARPALVALLASAALGACAADGGEAGALSAGTSTENLVLSGGVLANPAAATATLQDAYTARTGPELRDALARAATSFIKIVDVPGDAEIDLTEINCGPLPPAGTPDDAPCAPLVIAEGVTLRSNRAGRNPGGLISTARMRDHTVFRVEGTNARVVGLRLRGPSRSTSRDTVPVTGIGTPSTFATTIENNELSDFPRAAIEVYERVADTQATCSPPEPGRVALVRVAGNWIHHNQRRNLGYGVSVGGGGFALIERNVFDFNRHAIAGDGDARAGYRAIENLVLSGGAEYCDSGVLSSCWYEHHFDMHGQGDDADEGAAGDYVEIAHNTFRGEQDYGWSSTRAAYHVRATPCDRNDIHDNAFAHESDEAIRNDSDRANVHQWSNQFDVDEFDDGFGVGDFDGDGRDDLFVATGAAWFYSSGGEAAWRFLARRTERMRDLRVGDFDGDGRADIFTSAPGGQWRFSPRGTEPWRDLQWAAYPIADLRFGDFNGDRVTDVFYATGRTWYVSYGGASAWSYLGTSSYRAADLRFGDFDGDGRMDVLRATDGEWSVSWGGVSGWTFLNARLADDLRALVLADFDGDGSTDIASSIAVSDPDTGITRHLWRVSYGGWSRWYALRPAFVSDVFSNLRAHFIGRFDGTPGADALRWEPRGNALWRWSRFQTEYAPHSAGNLR